jgi:hypothetical protein
MSDGLETTWKKAVYSSILLEELGKIWHDSRILGWDLNSGPLERGKVSYHSTVTESADLYEVWDCRWGEDTDVGLRGYTIT